MYQVFPFLNYQFKARDWEKNCRVLVRPWAGWGGGQIPQKNLLRRSSKTGSVSSKTFIFEANVVVAALLSSPEGLPSTLQRSKLKIFMAAIPHYLKKQVSR